MKMIYCLVLSYFLICQQAVASDKVFSLSEVQLHNSSKDCWIVINDKIYDITKFIKDHDVHCKYSKLSDFCGKDASTLWIDKQKSDNAHKRKSILNLERSQIGKLPSMTNRNNFNRSN